MFTNQAPIGTHNLGCTHSSTWCHSPMQSCIIHSIRFYQRESPPTVDYNLNYSAYAELSKTFELQFVSNRSSKYAWTLFAFHVMQLDTMRSYIIGGSPNNCTGRSSLSIKNYCAFATWAKFPQFPTMHQRRQSPASQRGFVLYLGWEFFGKHFSHFTAINNSSIVN